MKEVQMTGMSDHATLVTENMFFPLKICKYDIKVIFKRKATSLDYLVCMSVCLEAELFISIRIHNLF